MRTIGADTVLAGVAVIGRTHSPTVRHDTALLAIHGPVMVLLVQIDVDCRFTVWNRDGKVVLRQW